MITKLIALVPTLFTDSVAGDIDDPAIWINRQQPANSLILGTDKSPLSSAVVAFDLQGKLVSRFTDIVQPNNVDVHGDLVAASERGSNRVRFFRLDAGSRSLVDVSGATACVEQPMGICFYRHPSTQRLYVFVSPKETPREGALAQYEVLESDGKFSLNLIRRVGKFSGVDEVESIAVDAERNLVFYGDESVTNWVYNADPAVPGNPFVAAMNNRSFEGDHEGIAVTRDYVFFTDQVDNNSRYHIVDRTNLKRSLGVLSIGADATDGIEATQTNLGPRFPKGLFVAMNSKDKNFALLDMRLLIRRLQD